MNLDQIEKELQSLKKKAENIKNELSMQIGKREAIMDRLKKEFDVSTIEQAEKKKAELLKEKEHLIKQLNNIKTKIDNKYSSIF